MTKACPTDDAPGWESRAEAPLARIADAIADPGWCVTPGFLSPEEVSALRVETEALGAQGAFRPAGIGRGQGLAVNPGVRSDQIHWLDPEPSGPAIRGYLTRLDALRQTLNRELFLGLADFEGHLAVYAPGSFYRRHLDQFHGVERRVLSCILYLNTGWQPADGGALRIYVDSADPERFAEIEPQGGTLVTFLSARFEHEVMPAQRKRLSLTGWFRRRA
jgi:SM-20-related protein